MEEISIPIRMLQHFIYCKRRFDLLYNEDQWQDNYKTIEGNLIHSLVDDPFFNEKRKLKHVSRSIPVYSDQYGLHGIVDCMEFIPDKNGIIISGKKGKFSISIIEYKNGKPLARDNQTVNHADAIQLQAQILCAKEMFQTEITGAVYYAGIKKRLHVPYDERLVSEIITAIEEMKGIMDSGKTPPMPVKKNCSNCSMEFVCLPKANKVKKSIHGMIIENLEHEETL